MKLSSALMAFLPILLFGPGVLAEDTCGPDSLHAVPTEVLIECLSSARIGWRDERWSVHDELVGRAPIDTLIDTVQHSADDAQRSTLLQVLYHLDDDRIAHAFRRCATPKVTEETYYCLNYLAKRGDATALQTLNEHYYSYPVSSVQWSFTVALFGKFRYRPATKNLLESVDAASLNVGFAAVEALQQIYPDAPTDFTSVEDAKVKLRRYLEQIGALH